MKKEEFIEKFQEIINKIDELCGGFDCFVVSGDPDCDCDYGVDDRGRLIIDGSSTNLPVEDLESIRYRAKSEYKSSKDGEFYIALHFKNNLSVYLYIDDTGLGENVAVSFENRNFDPDVSRRLIYCYDYHWGDDVAVYKDTLVAYLGNKEEISIGEGIKRIGSRAFANSKVKRVHLSNSVELIEPSAFIYSRIESIDLNNVKFIMFLAFWHCSELKHIVLPDSLNKIDKGAFSNSGIIDLKQIDNKSSIELGDWLFDPC